MELSDRKKAILRAIIQTYLETGEPVGSRTISKCSDLNLSSATIRNEMADLEEMGLIVQPHTSAGRIPSDRGYRLYVDDMMAEKEKELIADQDEVLKYLTAVMRGKSVSEVVVVEGVGEGCSEARTMEKAPDEKERLKAAELLGKRYGLYTDKIEADVDMELNINIDYGDKYGEES